jgi:hypothetical protein
VGDFPARGNTGLYIYSFPKRSVRRPSQPSGGAGCGRLGVTAMPVHTQNVAACDTAGGDVPFPLGNIICQKDVSID